MKTVSTGVAKPLKNAEQELLDLAVERVQDSRTVDEQRFFLLKKMVGKKVFEDVCARHGVLQQVRQMTESRAAKVRAEFAKEAQQRRNKT